MKIVWSQFIEHSKHCGKLNFLCPACLQLVENEEAKTHSMRCFVSSEKNMPKKCENNIFGCKASGSKMELAAHYSDGCPFSLTSCIDCASLVLSKDLPLHMQQCKSQNEPNSEKKEKGKEDIIENQKDPDFEEEKLIHNRFKMLEYNLEHKLHFYMRKKLSPNESDAFIEYITNNFGSVIPSLETNDKTVITLGF